MRSVTTTSRTRPTWSPVGSKADSPARRAINTLVGAVTGAGYCASEVWDAGLVTEAQSPALIAEASRKSDVLWLALPGRPQPLAAWHVWFDDAVHVVSGGGEQDLPGLDAADTVEVILRSKDKGARLVRWAAKVRHLTPGTDEWDAAARELLAKRLNLHDADRARERWARESRITRLDPTGEVSERPGAMSAESHAAAPLPSPATTVGPLPFVFGRRRS